MIRITFLLLLLASIGLSAQKERKLGFLGVDHHSEKRFDGLKIVSIMTFDHSYTYNGLTIGGIGSFFAKEVNGVSISGLVYNVKKHNGFLISPLISNTDTINGMSVSLMHFSKRYSGFATGVLGGCFEEFKGVGIYPLMQWNYGVSGLTLSSFNINSGDYKGLQLGLYNETIDGRVIQVGVINYIKSNPIWCRVLPIINMRLRK